MHPSKPSRLGLLMNVFLVFSVVAFIAIVSYGLYVARTESSPFKKGAPTNELKSPLMLGK